ncbi:MAG: hypothetical protein H7Y03_07740 [Chitinophagaceae bacterium]|nr:hypothetical protein [Chitinophagaceae bacterium]
MSLLKSYKDDMFYYGRLEGKREGKEEGLAQGKNEGIELGRLERDTVLVKNMLLKEKYSEYEIAEIAEVSLTFVNAVRKQVFPNVPPITN